MLTCNPSDILGLAAERFIIGVVKIDRNIPHIINVDTRGAYVNEPGGTKIVSSETPYREFALNPK